MKGFRYVVADAAEASIEENGKIAKKK